MDHYSILDQGSSSPAPGLAAANRGHDGSHASQPPDTVSPLRFPGDDGGKSLAETAQRDLNVALQLLAERAQYITGASGAAIALRQGEDLICCARAGSSAPEVGAELQVSSGLTGESVRTREVLRCNDAETDPRVNRESCKALGIASVMVMPLLQENEVIGVFELLSDRPHAFEERDVVALERLGEMISTAIEHAAAVKRGIEAVSAEPGNSAHHQAVPEEKSPQADGSETDLSSFPQENEGETVRPLLANIKKCQACGFPVSGSRTLCLDCEAAQNSEEPGSPGSRAVAPAFLAELGDIRKESWLHEHMYTIGIVLMAALTAVLLLWLHPV
jgi:putative methionine-R-sulfoxide reductase with GAF domain